ncbi:MAG: sel1 repeat family protein, partial [Synergistaceae bacterium]|nr:sel1 repeat family protein [Synergistaceae bacterium]
KSMMNLGRMYEDGTGVSKDINKAVSLYRKAADKGNNDAKEALARLNVSPELPKKQSSSPSASGYDEIANLTRRAEENDPEALHILGMRYVEGNGVKHNKRLGFRMVKQAADMGYAPAECDVGYLYSKGRGTNVDRKLALEYFIKAAEKGEATAQNNLGAMYHNGEYVRQNFTKAFHWYKKAAEQGSTIAQQNLGKMYEFGQGIQKNPKEAVKWYQKAAEKGDEYSIKALKRLGLGPKESY